MQSSTIDVWAAALEKLEQIVNEDLMEMWFRKMQCIEITDSTCVVEIDTDFRRDWVRSNYSDLLSIAVREVTQPEMEVVVESFESRMRSSDTDEYSDYDVDRSDKAALRSTARKLEFYEEEEEEIVVLEDLETLRTQANLNPNYTFDSFVIGPSNELLVAAAKRVARGDKRYNPLFMYGNVGLGKTHLLHAIGNAALEYNRSLRVVATSAEAFMNDMIMSIQNNDMTFFRTQYRDQCDLLLIDDVQFLRGKKSSTQGEFFHTFNALHQSGKQIIMTSDLSPRELEGLDHRLTSRFAWGLVSDIRPPDYDMRYEIITRKAKQDDLYLPDEVVHLLASTNHLNIRELEGAIISLGAHSLASKQPVTLSKAKETLNRLGMECAKSVTIERIIEVVSKRYNVSPEDLKGSSRPKHISTPRQIAMYLSKKLTDFSYKKIGISFGGKDHTTVMTAYNKYKSLVEKDGEVAAEMEVVEGLLL